VPRGDRESAGCNALARALAAPAESPLARHLGAFNGDGFLGVERSVSGRRWVARGGR